MRRSSKFAALTVSSALLAGSAVVMKEKFPDQYQSAKSYITRDPLPPRHRGEAATSTSTSVEFTTDTLDPNAPIPVKPSTSVKVTIAPTEAPPIVTEAPTTTPAPPETAVPPTAAPTTAQAVGACAAGKICGVKNIVWIGDSLSNGMKQTQFGGKIESQIAAKGMALTAYQGIGGINVPNSITTFKKYPSFEQYITGADTAVVELGTNHCTLLGSGTKRCEDETTFTPRIQQMVGFLRGYNPAIRILWVNVHTKAFAADNSRLHSGINSAITAQSSVLNYVVSDWDTEANGGGYAFQEPTLEIHPSTADSWHREGAFILSSLQP